VNAKPKKAKTRSLEGITREFHGRLDELGGNAVMRKLTNAREQAAYWRMRKASAALLKDRIDAGARELIWKNEVAACERRLRELTRTHELSKDARPTVCSP
jgi:hypothetical protein